MLCTTYHSYASFLELVSLQKDRSRILCCPPGALGIYQLWCGVSGGVSSKHRRNTMEMQSAVQQRGVEEEDLFSRYFLRPSGSNPWGPGDVLLELHSLKHHRDDTTTNANSRKRLRLTTGASTRGSSFIDSLSKAFESTLTDDTSAIIAPFTRAAISSPFDPKWMQTAISVGTQRCRQIAEWLLEGKSSQPKFGSVNKDNIMRRMLARRGLLVVSPTTGSSAKMMPMMTQQQNDSSMPEASGAISGEAIKFCMSSPHRQWFTLLQIVLEEVAATSSSTTSSVMMTDACSLCCSLLQCAKSMTVCAFPDKTLSATLNKLVTRLSDVGFVLPMQVDKQLCFIVTPFLSLAMSSAPTTVDAQSSSLTISTGRFGNTKEKVMWTPQLQNLMMSYDQGSTGAEKSGEGSTEESFNSEEEGIITETNFTVFAYTRNPTLIAILKQFVTVETVVDGYFHCCQITRESFTKAVSRGISSTQVIQFLSLHAHPSVAAAAALTADTRHNSATTGRSVTTLIPHSVCDQLKMWERESHRIKVENDCVKVSADDVVALRLLVESYAADNMLQPHDVILYADDHHLIVKKKIFEEALKPHVQS